MLKKIGFLLLGVFTFFCGMGIIEMALTDPEFNVGSMIFAIFCGILFIIGGVVLLVMSVREIRMSKKKKAGIAGQAASEVKELVSRDFKVITQDNNKTEELIREFRNDYGTFFAHKGLIENDPIQRDATQLYWHILSLQKKRLDSKGIVINMHSDRLSYGAISPVRKSSYFDGKYEVTEVVETVEAKQEFVTEAGKKIHKRKFVQAAVYRILGAARKQYTQVVCPNCGQISTREDLIDGCDYCGTKFTVEDLDDRVSDFAFQNDYGVEYAKYKSARKTYIPRATLIIGIPILLFCIYGSILAFPEMDGPYTLRIAGLMFAIAFPTAGLTFCGVYCFMVMLFPFIQIFASAKYLSKRALSKLETNKYRNEGVAAKIREHDHLFSLNGFYSNIQNKLAFVHFAGSSNEAAAFFETKQGEEALAAVIPSYQDIIDVQIDDMRLTEFSIGEYLQEIKMTVELSLLSDKGGLLPTRKEKVALHLVKDVNCKSQTVCAPSFTNCKQCGAPMSLMDGRVCQYCGHARRLAEYDWAIRSYDVLK